MAVQCNLNDRNVADFFSLHDDKIYIKNITFLKLWAIVHFLFCTFSSFFITSDFCSSESFSLHFSIFFLFLLFLQPIPFISSIFFF